MDIRIEELYDWINAYRGLGIAIAFILPILEAFFPILPLIAIVTGNAVAFGMWKGFFFTWLGACTGSLLVFWLIRTFSRNWTERLFHRYKGIEKSSKWFEKHGFSVLFLLRCFPFSPSSLINVLAGLSAISFHTYFWATILGKAVMVFILSYIGADLPQFIREPVKLITLLLGVALLWGVGKLVEKRYLPKS
ncbi:TVP38/TMEM64 family protein [Ammoniphilus sp. CFH 90114]|uniref:TVP38/TMEM64 family protein n=1 Tax=Ammoniphilus sp. CFH 90114 TaxID=2493665 RepID=UPI0013E9836E|nr:TVP38/TMEM64 family protein [Ammoniphilus sp. CFH 90114]